MPRPDRRPPPLASPAEVEERLRALCPSQTSEMIALAEAAGRVLWEPVRADRDGPPFDRAMLDGIALRVEDWRANGLPVAGSQLAGDPPLELPAGACCEIMTGAVVPAGADCVIGYEVIEIEAGRVKVAHSEIESGAAIHRRGSDFAQGDTLIPARTLLTSRLLAVAASNGCAMIAVTRRPRVGLLATGDEVVPIEQTPAPWQIRRSNAVLLASAARAAGAEVTADDHAPDDLATTTELLQRQSSCCDVLITAGGIALGERDFLPQALNDLGAMPILRGVAQRPGKPFGFWQMPDGPLVFTLPGNPMSVAVTFSRYVAPFLRSWQGQDTPAEIVRIAADCPSHERLTQFLPVERQSRDGGLHAVPRPLQNSGDLAGAFGSTGFVEIPPHTTVARGDRLCYYPWL